MSGQNGQRDFSAQRVIDDYLKTNRVKGQVKILGGKFSYEVQSDGKCKYNLVEKKDGYLFIGILEENGNPCVIRRYDTNDSDAKKFLRDLEALQTKKKNLHENFIRFFCREEVEKKGHTYYAVELCRYSVEELIRNELTETLYEHVWKTLTREKIMHQTTLGLDYLHGLEGGFIHRNIHGRNVLVAEIPTRSDRHYVVKLSDFRFGKQAEIDKQNSLTKPDSGWIAPEMNNPRERLESRTDVFILGCFFYYVLSGGNHPFGKNIPKNDEEKNRKTNNYKEPRKANICNPKFKPNWTEHNDDGNYKNMSEEGQNKLKATVEKYLELMKRMTSFKISDRPTTGQILRHFDTKDYYDIYPAIAAPIDGSKSAAATTRPGLCVIFHQDQFKNPVSNLPGYRKDVESLIKTFWLFGYDLRIYADLEGQELLQTVKNLAEERGSDGHDSIFKGYSSLVVCILSHGSLGTVDGVDGQLVNVNELQWAFSSDKCPDLQDKAKIFFIQACQGNKAQNPRECFYEEAMAIKKQEETLQRNAEPVAKAAEVRVIKPSITKFSEQNNLPNADLEKNTATMMTKAPFSDVMTMWATIIDYLSFVHPVKGSTFIQSLCYHLVDSLGGTRITGGDRIRDLYDAHLAIIQDVSSTPINARIQIKDEKTGNWEERIMNVNQTPIYQSTACGKKVGFQVIEQRCKEITYFSANKDYISNIFGKAAHDAGSFRIVEDEKFNPLNLVWRNHTTFNQVKNDNSNADVAPMECE